MIQRLIALMFAGSLLFSPFAEAEEGGSFVKPQGRYKCPVCGMFVAKYPDWITEVVFTDGTYAIFDGSKDLFKFYFAVPAYVHGKTRADISAVIVTDYYTIQQVDGRKAFYVLGSDVFGPMGKELVPFGKESDAREFLKDHQGKRILTFEEVTPEIIGELER